MKPYHLIPYIIASNHSADALVHLIKKLKGLMNCPHIFFEDMPSDKLRYELEAFCYYLHENNADPKKAITNRFPIKENDYLVHVKSIDIQVLDEPIEVEDSTDECRMITITQQGEKIVLNLTYNKLHETNSSSINK